MKISLERFKNTRVTENIHIHFWLNKDTCRVMEIKLLGVLMIIPTILIALFIAYRTFRSPEFFVNLAVLFWIMANSFWMSAEFYNFLEYKYITGFPFTLGFLCFFVYLYQLIRTDTNNK